MITTSDQDFLLAVETTGEQKEIWNSCQFDESSSLCFNESITIEFAGELDTLALEKALVQVLERHSSLRSCFSADGKHMMIRNHQSLSLEKITYTDKKKVNEKEKEECLTLFDLANGPLIRFVLLTPEIQGAQSKSYLILTAHHIVCDGWSWAIITSDLGHFYNNQREKVFVPLSKAAQYWNYSKSKLAANKSLDQEFWKSIFYKAQEKIEYSTTKERPVFRTFNSSRVDTPCSSETIKALRGVARKNKLTLYQYLLAAFFMTLSKKAKAKDITVGISQAGQTIPEFSSLVGHCVGLLPIRIESFDSENFEKNFDVVKSAMLGAQKHSQLSFGEICELTMKERDPSRVPLVPITFNLDVQPPGQGLNFKGLESRFKTNPRYFENFEMFINLTLIGDNAVIENQYNTDLFSKEEVVLFQEVYRSFLDHLASEKPGASFPFEAHFQKVPKTTSEREIVEVVPKKTKVIESSVSSELVEKLKSIWKQVLFVDEVKPQDGFFALGGHSLLVTEVILAVRDQLGITLTMKDLFLNQEFNKFTQIVSSKTAEGTTIEETEDSTELLRIEKNTAVHLDKLPLSWQQQRTWLFQKINPESTLFNLPSLFQFRGDIDVEALKNSLLHFQDSHPLVNSKLITKDGIPYWDWDKKNSHHVEVVDLKKKYPNQPIDSIIKELVEIHTTEANQPFDMDGVLYQAKIYYFKDKSGDQYTFLAQKVHHIIWDGWCYDIFLEELENNYLNLIGNKELAKPLELTYFDYSKWQSGLPEKSFYQEKLEFWKKQFADVPDPLDLPIKPGLKRTEKKHKGKSLFIQWSEDTIRPLEKIARDNGTTLYNVLMTTFKLFLSRYSGQTDIVVGTPVRGRDAKDLDKVIGFFVNNIAIRSTVDSTLTFSENLKRVVENSALAYENGLVPFDVVVREVVKSRDTARTPLYQAFFMYQDATNRNSQFGESQRSSYRLPRGACHTDIDFWARRDREGMIGGFDFDVEIFSEEQMNQMAGDFEYFLSEISELENSKKPVKKAKILNPSHQEYVLKTLNQTDVAFSENKTIGQLIDEVATDNSDKVAIISSEGRLSYGEVKKLSDSLASFLIGKGVKTGDLVGMALPRNHYLPVCLLGIIKAGAGYVPLDPTYPEDRLSYMIENSKLQYVICDPEDVSLSIFSKVETIGLGDPLRRNQNFAAWNYDQRPETSIKTEDTCYVIYTSGSTGLPKGVDISHRAMVNFLESMVKSPGVGKNDTLIAVTTMSFDIAVLEIYAPLLAGASVYVCTKEESMFGDSLMEVIRQNQGTFLQATPATWRQLVVSGLSEYTNKLSQKGQRFKSLCGGEPLPNDLKAQILDSVHELWNMYGPTETTVWSTCHQVLKDESWISVGRPIDNTQIYILSENLELCPYGGVGELCIGGDGLARGYLNRPELTSERFVPCDSLNGKIVYRTGDLGRYRENGLLECLGRNDGQVKVRGFRIELGEIESIISQTPGIASQVVIVREDRPGDARIAAYFIREKGTSKAEKELVFDIQKKIKENLPFYMMPSHFLELPEFPLTLNGKIDRKKLPSPSGNLTDASQTTSVQERSNQGNSLLRGKFEKIWCECLGTESAKDEDDFFQVGGHSLLSVNLFSRIETELGVALPLSTLFQKTTFGALLRELEGFNSNSNETTLVKLDSDYVVALRKSENANKALFLFHGVGGNILNYKKLIQFVPDSFDIYGVQSPGVLGEAALAKSVSEMAILYANDISNIKGYQKLIFGGGSMGGLMAFETAREMKDLKGKVDDIIMFDTFGPREAFSHITGQKPPSFFSRLSTYSYFKIREINAKFHTWLAGIKGKPVPHKYRHFLVELNNYGLMNRHQILPLDAHVHLLRAPVTAEGNYSLEDLGWKKVANKGCTSHIVKEADHYNFVESPLAGKSFRKLLEGF